MSNDFRPTASIETLRERARVVSRIRQFFDGRDFFEVQTPTLSRDTVVDRFIEPLPVEIRIPGDSEETFWLQTSPEFAMKRLLAAGARAIYQMAAVFRGDETGPLHNIEFTMLEWYQAGDDYRQGMNLLDEFARDILDCDAAVRLSYCEAFDRFCGFDLRTKRGLKQLEKIRIEMKTDRPLDQLLVENVEPGLKELGSVILYDWPADQAALARTRKETYEGLNEFAERFELYVDGVELANGYHELTDPDVLLARNRQVNADRMRDNRPPLPEDSRLLDAMRSGLPDSCGVALGVDRLVMLALGKSSIRQVMCFDSHRA